MSRYPTLAIAIIFRCTLAGAQDLPSTPLTFEERCASAGVILCDPLDASPVKGIAVKSRTANKNLPEALEGKFRDWRWCTHSPKTMKAPPILDREVKASGSGSLRFNITSPSKDDAAGYCQINFTPDNSVQFGEGDTFYVQFRVRFSCDLLYLDCDPKSPDYKTRRRAYRAKKSGSTAYKISIINSGDHESLEFPSTSCSNQHLVLIGDGRGVVHGYHSCGWYDEHARNLGLSPKNGRIMVDMQPKPRGTVFSREICHKSGSPGANPDDPTRGCFLLTSDEWLTFTQRVTIGRWVDKLVDPSRSSNVTLWVAREGMPPELVYSLDRNLRRPEQPFMKYGKIWLIPFFTNKDPTEIHPDAYMWFDELIVSSAPIAPAQ